MTRIARMSLRVFLLAVLGFFAVVVTPVCGWAADDETPKRSVVVLVIDYGDGVQKHFRQLPHKAGMTVLDVLEAARRHPRGIKFVHRGEGATAFLVQIDDLKNEGSGRNWIYSINDKLGDRSFAICEVKEGETVLWKFSKYR